MNGFRNIVATICTFILLSQFSCAYFVRSPRTGEHITFRNVPSANRLLPMAIEEAQKHHSDPSLLGIDISVTSESVITSFDFISVEEPKVVILVNIREYGELKIESKEIDVLDESRLDEVIGAEEWTLDSTEIAELAFENCTSESSKIGANLDRILIQLGTISGSANSRMGANWQGIAWRVALDQQPDYSLDCYFDPISGELIGSISR